MNRPTKKIAIAAVISFISIAILAGIDQIVKIFIDKTFVLYEEHKVIGDLLVLEYIRNDGCAWGMMSGKQIMLIVFTVFILLAAIYVYVRLLMQDGFIPLKIAVIFMISGAIGNMIDRVIRNFVIDFIYVKVINFPVFNVADIYVTCSMFAIVILIFTLYRNEDFKFLTGKK